MNQLQISDSDLKALYQKRFALPIGGDYIKSSKDVLLYLRGAFEHRDREQFIIIYLDLRNRITASETLFTGSLGTSAVYPREVVKAILKNEAAAVVLAHNHPSGNLQPSHDDRTITGKIKDICTLIDVKVHDHLIITTSDYYSFADHGLV